MTIPNDANHPGGGMPRNPGTPGAQPVTPVGGTSSESKPKIDISNDDLYAEDIQERVSEMERGRQVALVREVGNASEAKGGGSLQAILILTGGGAVGGLLAFVFTRIETALELTQDNVFASNLLFTFTLAFFIGTAVALADVIVMRSWSKLGSMAAIVIPTAVVAGLVIGVIAHLLYSAGQEWMLENALRRQFVEGLTDFETLDAYINDPWRHVIRGAAWMLVGVAAGITAGVGSKSIKRVGVAVAGGAAGGFLGGFVFDFIPGEFAAQIIGIVILGTLIGLATGLVEQAAKSRWIEIVSGGLAGKQFILYKKQIQLGSSPQADITIIKDSSIPDFAAVIDTGSGQTKITATNPMIPVVVNGVAQVNCAIADGDIITLGSSQLRFREKASDSKVPGALRS